MGIYKLYFIDQDSAIAKAVKDKLHIVGTPLLLCLLFTYRVMYRGSCSIVVQCLPGLREVPGSNPLGGNILCSPSPL